MGLMEFLDLLYSNVWIRRKEKVTSLLDRRGLCRKLLAKRKLLERMQVDLSLRWKFITNVFRGVYYFFLKRCCRLVS